mgnify:CR=1 FL=1
MTFDREPDLDNANVGMFDTFIAKYAQKAAKSVAFFLFSWKLSWQKRRLLCTYFWR